MYVGVREMLGENPWKFNPPFDKCQGKEIPAVRNDLKVSCQVRVSYISDKTKTEWNSY